MRRNTSQKISKWLLDITVCNILGPGNKEFKELTNISLDVTGGDVVEYYTLHLADSLDVKQMKRDYFNLEMKYKFEGELAVWRDYDYIAHYTRTKFKLEHKLYGEYLEQQVAEKSDTIARKLSVESWDIDNYNTMHTLIHVAFTWHETGNKEYGDDLRSDIATNREEGKDFSINIEEIQNSNNNLLDLYNDPTFYSQTMETVEIASRYLFTDDSGGKSNLDILYYSIFNHMTLEDALQLQTELEETFEGVSVDIKADNPIKFEYRKYRGGMPKWGHLPHVNAEYRNMEPGNESRINEIVGSGKLIVSELKKIMSSNDLIKNNMSVYFAQVCLEIQREFAYSQDEQGNMLVGKQYEYKLSPMYIKHIIQGMHAAAKVKQVIEAAGKRFMCFPSVEIRQSTWKRFSTYKELMEYHVIHESLEELMRRKYKYNLGEINISVTNANKAKKDIVPKEILILEELEKFSINLKFTARDNNNRKVKRIETGEETLYKNIIGNLKYMFEESERSLRHLRDNPEMLSMIGLVMDVVKTSLVFFNEVPEDYRIKSNMRGEKTRVPDIGELVEPLESINRRGKLVDSDMFKCSVFTQSIQGNRGTPRKALALVQDAHKSIYERLQEVYEVQGLGSTIRKFNGDHGRTNLNGALNIHLSNQLRGITIDLLRKMLQLAGQEIINGRIENVGPIRPVIEGVVNLVNMEIVVTIMRCKTVEEFVKVEVYDEIQKTFKLEGRHLKACKVILQYISEENQSMYNKLRDVLVTYFKFNQELNMSGTTLDTLTTMPFERDMRKLSRRMETYAIQNMDFQRNAQMYNILEAYALNSNSVLLGIDGVPYTTVDPKNGGYWFYSTLEVKTRYPSTNNIIVAMDKEDVEDYLEAVNNNQGR